MTSGSVQVECANELSIGRADALRDILLAALSKGRDVEIDCSAATGVDVSFIQLLLAARTTAALRGVRLVLKSAAAGPLAATLRACGLIGGDGLPSDKFWMGGN